MIKGVMAGLLLALSTTASAVTPVQLSSARAFVRALYQNGVMGPGDYRNVRWSPEIRDWLRRDDAASRGEVGAFDTVPFCDCQDSSPGDRLLSVDAASTGPATVRATALVRVGRTHRFIYDLRWVAGHWVIENLHSRLIPDLRQLLRREVPREERSRR